MLFNNNTVIKFILFLSLLSLGGLLCPGCKEMCEQEFNERGEQCRKSEEAPSNNHYPKDHLTCTASYSSHKAVLVISFAFFLFGLR
jgi:hypothetical protein